jgi:hypothetical protein
MVTPVSSLLLAGSTKLQRSFRAVFTAAKLRHHGTWLLVLEPAHVSEEHHDAEHHEYASWTKVYLAYITRYNTTTVDAIMEPQLITI